jgi:methionine-rich copper-binding protein CopC
MDMMKPPRRARRARLLVGALLGLLAALALPGLALAHAHPTSSSPAADAVLTTAPTAVTIHFSEELDPAGSDIVVYDSKHQQVSTGQAQVDRADLTKMSVPMKGSGTGTYLVEWHNLSTDGHALIGAYTFKVSDTVTPTSGTPAADTSDATASASGGTPGWVVALVGIVGLILGGLGGSLLARRR